MAVLLLLTSVASAVVFNMRVYFLVMLSACGLCCKICLHFWELFKLIMDEYKGGALEGAVVTSNNYKCAM